MNDKNIILIGMPGCGKSTIAALLAEKLGRTALDSDSEVIRLAGKPIPDIFAQDGEKAFRALETQALSAAAKESGAVIATGGGAVLRKENRDAMKQNGTVIFLERDISSLATDGRPLSSSKKKLKKMKV